MIPQPSQQQPSNNTTTFIITFSTIYSFNAANLKGIYILFTFLLDIFLRRLVTVMAATNTPHCSYFYYHHCYYHHGYCYTAEGDDSTGPHVHDDNDVIDTRDVDQHLDNEALLRHNNNEDDDEEEDDDRRRKRERDHDSDS